MKTRLASLFILGIFLVSCDRIGSEAWCEKMGDKPNSEWTLEETGNYTKYCVLGMNSEKWCEKLEKKDKGDWTANEASRYAQNCLVGRSDKDDDSRD